MGGIFTIPHLPRAPFTRLVYPHWPRPPGAVPAGTFDTSTLAGYATTAYADQIGAAERAYTINAIVGVNAYMASHVPMVLYDANNQPIGQVADFIMTWPDGADRTANSGTVLLYSSALNADIKVPFATSSGLAFDVYPGPFYFKGTSCNGTPWVTGAAPGAFFNLGGTLYQADSGAAVAIGSNITRTKATWSSACTVVTAQNPGTGRTLNTLNVTISTVWPAPFTMK